MHSWRENQDKVVKSEEILTISLLVGRTMLHYASMFGGTEAASLMLEHHANVNKVDRCKIDSFRCCH